MYIKTGSKNSYSQGMKPLLYTTWGLVLIIVNF